MLSKVQRDYKGKIKEEEIEVFSHISFKEGSTERLLAIVDSLYDELEDKLFIGVDFKNSWKHTRGYLLNRDNFNFDKYDSYEIRRILAFLYNVYIKANKEGIMKWDTREEDYKNVIYNPYNIREKVICKYLEEDFVW